VPSRAPDEYCAQSSIPAAAIVAANTVATRATAVKYLRSGMRTTEGGGEGRRGVRLVTWITPPGGRSGQASYPPESPKVQTSVVRASN